MSHVTNVTTRGEARGKEQGQGQEARGERQEARGERQETRGERQGTRGKRREARARTRGTHVKKCPPAEGHNFQKRLHTSENCCIFAAEKKR